MVCKPPVEGVKVMCLMVSIALCFACLVAGHVVWPLQLCPGAVMCLLAGACQKLIGALRPGLQVVS